MYFYYRVNIYINQFFNIRTHCFAGRNWLKKITVGIKWHSSMLNIFLHIILIIRLLQTFLRLKHLGCLQGYLSTFFLNKILLKITRPGTVVNESVNFFLSTDFTMENNSPRE